MAAALVLQTDWELWLKGTSIWDTNNANMEFNGVN